jgi:RNA polymerase sigma-70 factor (ECF subfamily)
MMRDEAVDRMDLGGARSPALGTPMDAALETYVATHYPRLVRLARLVCRDEVDATDAVQSGLEQAWRHRADLRDEERRRAWLDRIVVREAIRISKRRQSWLSRVFGLERSARWIEPATESTSDLALRESLRTAFAHLSAEQRAVVALHMYAGYSVAETARIVGIPLETARSRLRLARERLRRELEEVAP